MKHIITGIFFLLTVLSAKSQFKTIAEGPEFDEPEKGYTRIEGDNQKTPYLRVFAGKETDVMCKNQFADFAERKNC